MLMEYVKELIDTGIIDINYKSKKYSVDSEWFNQYNEPFTILGLDSSRDDGYYYIYFDEYDIIRVVHSSMIKKGNIKTPYSKTIYGKGYLGEGKYNINEGGIVKSYKVWNSMLQRCYAQEYLNRRPSYNDITVCEDWLEYQNFAEWFEKNYIEGYHLDKDLLSKGKKIYSPETCVFLPNDINQFLSKMNSKGIYEMNGRWYARIKTSGKCKHLGGHSSKEEAERVYKDYRHKEAETIKNKMKDLGYSETIIQKVR